MRFKERHSPLLSQRLYVVPMTTRKQGSAQRQIPLLNYLVLFKSASTLNLTNAHTLPHRHTYGTSERTHAHTLEHAANSFSSSSLLLAYEEEKHNYV